MITIVVVVAHQLDAGREHRDADRAQQLASQRAARRLCSGSIVSTVVVWWQYSSSIAVVYEWYSSRFRVNP